MSEDILHGPAYKSSRSKQIVCAFDAEPWPCKHVKDGIKEAEKNAAKDVKDARERAASMVIE